MSRARRNGELCLCMLPVTQGPNLFYKKQLKESMDEGETEEEEEDDDDISDSPSTPGN